MSLVEGVVQPTYFAKSFLKIVTFLGCIVAYYVINRDRSLFDCLSYKVSLKGAILLGIAMYLFIMVAYYGLQFLLDFDTIVDNLLAKENISKDNFIMVALYISVVNSFLEEVFFRGFAFLELKKYLNVKWASIISATCFAVYHTFIMGSWFSPFVFVLLMTSLIVGGLIFNYLDQKGSIYPSWFVHMSANLAINTVGLIMFGLV
ncbi:MAG TPA: CPBP family intramembrane metalloprotease [Firmicutes bacterium]|nr:CPBP family intramembrane metalloprotease [Bacillota bacterium]